MSSALHHRDQRQLSFASISVEFSNLLSYYCLLPFIFLGFASLFPHFSFQNLISYIKAHLFFPSPPTPSSLLRREKNSKKNKKKIKRQQSCSSYYINVMGSSSSPRLSSTKRKKAMKEVVQGRDFATQLQGLLHKPFGDDGLLSAEELVVKIIRSFTETLAVLGSSDQLSDEVCQNLGNSDDGSPCCDNDRRSEDSEESSRKRPASSKDKRGCYKRSRKNSQTWIVVSPTIEDGQAWRKYGQKEILNAKYPRSYFRCTRKYDQGCRATKQVQQVEQNPPMYQNTYIGLHTCRNVLKAPQIITDSDPWQSYIVNSDSNIPAADTLSDLTDNLSPFDSILWSDFNMGSDHGDVVSKLDMDFMVKPVEFDNNLHFDETDFL